MTAEPVPRHIVDEYRVALEADLKGRRRRVLAFNAALVVVAVVLGALRGQADWISPVFFLTVVAAVLSAIISAFVVGLDRSSNRAFYGTLLPSLFARSVPDARYDPKPSVAPVIEAGLYPRLATTLVPWRLLVDIEGRSVDMYGVYVFDNKRRNGGGSNLFDGVHLIVHRETTEGAAVQQLRTWGKPSLRGVSMRELGGDSEVKAFVSKGGPDRVDAALLDIFNAVRAERPGQSVLLCAAHDTLHLAVGQGANVRSLPQGDVSAESVGRVYRQLADHVALATALCRRL